MKTKHVMKELGNPTSNNERTPPKIKKRQITIALFMVCLVSIGCDQGSIDRESIVKINSSSGSCSGFFVAPGTIMTSSHCGEDDTEFDITYLNENDVAQTTIGTLIQRDDGPHGTALIAVDLDGLEVQWCGARIGSSVEIWGWKENDIYTNTGRVLSHIDDAYTTTAESIMGLSGGPMAHGDCVIGVLQGKTVIHTSYASVPEIYLD